MEQFPGLASFVRLETDRWVDDDTFDSPAEAYYAGIEEAIVAVITYLNIGD